MAEAKVGAGYVVLGTNADPTKNFRISVPTIEDGTLSIARGDGTPVLTVDADGVRLDGTTIPSFVARKNADQTGIVTATWTKLTFQTLDVNVGGYFASDKFTPPAGKYHLACMANISATAAGQRLAVAIYKNGAEVKSQLVFSGASGSHSIGLSALLEANGTDYFELWVFQASGTSGTVDGTIPSYTWFDGHRISD